MNHDYSLQITNFWYWQPYMEFIKVYSHSLTYHSWDNSCPPLHWGTHRNTMPQGHVMWKRRRDLSRLSVRTVALPCNSWLKYRGSAPYWVETALCFKSSLSTATTSQFGYIACQRISPHEHVMLQSTICPSGSRAFAKPDRVTTNI